MRWSKPNGKRMWLGQSWMAIALAMSLGINVASRPTDLRADQVKLDVSLAYPIMKVSPGSDQPNAKAENHLRIALTGFELPRSKQRTPVNVAIVIDQSGSMSGSKIQHAKLAASQAIDLLQDSDIVSVLTYDDGVQVLVPATKASDRSSIKAKIEQIRANGSTALFAGVSQGAAEVRKFMSKEYVNRVILLSDGQANVGPSSPSELEEFGRSLIKEGISVSTFGLGLGYNEDLMTKLALASSGNHAFVEAPEHLVAIFQNEFRDAQSVIAQKIAIQAKFAEGIRPVKVLGYPAEIVGQMLTFEVGQLYSKQLRYFVVEIEVPLGLENTSRPVVEVTARYRNMITETTDQLASSLEVKFHRSTEVVDAAIDKDVFAACVLQCANERNRLATELRDRGDIAQSKKLLEYNADYLQSNFLKTGKAELQQRGADNRQQAQAVESADWGTSRKTMRALQTQDANQQSYQSTVPGKK